jgi:hypothetical protein
VYSFGGLLATLNAHNRNADLALKDFAQELLDRQVTEVVAAYPLDRDNSAPVILSQEQESGLHGFNSTIHIAEFQWPARASSQVFLAPYNQRREATGIACSVALAEIPAPIVGSRAIDKKYFWSDAVIITARGNGLTSYQQTNDSPPKTNQLATRDASWQ